MWPSMTSGIFRENRDRDIYHSTTISPNLRPIASSVSEIQRPLYAIVRTIELEKLWSKCVATHSHAASIYYECTKIDFGRGLLI